MGGFYSADLSGCKVARFSVEIDSGQLQNVCVGRFYRANRLSLEAAANNVDERKDEAYE